MPDENATQMQKYSQYAHWKGALAVLLNMEGEAKILQRFESDKAYAFKIQTINHGTGEVRFWRVTTPINSARGLVTVEQITEEEDNG